MAREGNRGHAGGAVARRNRTLKVYGMVALLAGGAAIVYCATRPGFDLSTPGKALDTFQRAMDGHRWEEAAKCLSRACRQHYAGPIADRRLFEFYSPFGYDTEFGRVNCEWYVKNVKAEGDRALADLCPRGPYGGQAVLRLQLEKGSDGMWRVCGPLEDFEVWYKRLIPTDAHGWAKAVEKR
jgi:hypothetical protein